MSSTSKAKSKSKSKSKSTSKSQETRPPPSERENNNHHHHHHEVLTPHQQQALDQLRELTNGADDEVSMGVLKSVEWDVERAAELIFESSSHPSSSFTFPEPTIPKPTSGQRHSGPSPLPSTSSTGSLSSLGSAFGHVNGGSSGAAAAVAPTLRRTVIEPFEIDDSSQTQPYHQHHGNGNGAQQHSGLPFNIPLPRPLITFLTFPFHFLTTLVRFVFGVLRIRLPRLPGGLGFAGLGAVFGGNVGRHIITGFGRRDGRVGYGESWLREVEEETGAVWLGRVVRDGQGGGDGYAASGIDVGVAGPSGGGGVVRRGGGGMGGVEWGKGRKYFFDFEVCGYEEFLRMCVRERKVGCVVLVSEEHDDVLGFKRGTLVDQELVRRMYEAGVVCWGGDVRDREAWSAGEKLQATTYPFVAFIALQSRRGTNVLTVLSRHQGKSATTATTLTSHLDTNVLPRVLPFLNTLIQEEKGRERDRALRAEQDRAYEESRRRDREKWEREQKERMAEEREKARREGEERERVERERRRVDVGRKVWGVVGVLRGGAGTGAGEVRVVIRMPGGERVVEKFGREESVSLLYAVVDRLLAGGEAGDDDLGPEMNQGELDSLIDREGGKDFWGFKIVSAYPRKEIEWREGLKIGDVDTLVGGGQVVVEGGAVVNGNGNGDDSEEED